MKTKLFVIASVLFFFLIFSCEKEEKENGINSSLLKRIEGEGGSWLFTYNDDNSLARIEEYYDDELETYMIFDYDHENRIEKITEYFYDHDTSVVVFFSYNQDTVSIQLLHGISDLIKVVLNDEDLPEEVIKTLDQELKESLFSEMITWDGGNIIKIENYSQIVWNPEYFPDAEIEPPVKISETNFIYDNKKNPFQSISLQTSLALFGLEFDMDLIFTNTYFFSGNNPMNINHHDIEDDSDEAITISYTFNENDLPVSMKINTSDDSESYSFIYY